MQELDDNELLREYVERASEEAFTALIQRHINKVYSIALRHVRNPHHAEEITQAVFVILSSKSRNLLAHTCLSGWLYQTTRLASVTFLRGEIRRARREQEACMQNGLDQTNTETWRQIEPLLDSAIAGLSSKDRDAIVLRFFDGKSMKDVGAALSVNEEAAKKRVNRGLDKLRKFFTKHGVASTAILIGEAISANSVQAAPPALAKTISALVIAKGAVAGVSTLTLVTGTLKIMAWTKTKTLIITAAALLFAGGTTYVMVKAAQEDEIALRKAEALPPVRYTLPELWQTSAKPRLAEMRVHKWPAERKKEQQRIQSRQKINEAPNAVTINLSSHVNVPLTEALGTPGCGNTLQLPAGVNIYAGIPFDVRGTIRLRGQDNYPSEAANIRIDRRCAKIHLLHGSEKCYARNFGLLVGRLVLHYTDDSKREIDLIAGKQVFDFWMVTFKTGVDPKFTNMAPGTEFAWTGTNPLVQHFMPEESILLYKSTFENPQPNVPLASIDYVSTMTEVAPFLVGLTVE